MTERRGQVAGSLALVVLLAVACSSPATRGTQVKIDFADQTAYGSPVPSAGQQRSCLAAPSSCGFPDATNVGVRPGRVLRVVRGDVHTTKDGQVVAGLDIRGTLFVDHSGVVVEDVKVTGAGGSSWAVQIGRDRPVKDVVVQDCTVDGSSSDQGGVLGGARSSWALVNCDVFNSENAVRASGNARIQSNYLHAFASTSRAAHYDGVEIYEGDGTTVVHNTIVLDRAETSTVNVQATFGRISRTRLEANLLDGGGWQLNVRTLDGPVVGTDVVGNRFGRAAVWGLAALDDASVNEIRGNVDDLSGKSVDPVLDRR